MIEYFADKYLIINPASQIKLFFLENSSKQETIKMDHEVLNPKRKLNVSGCINVLLWVNNCHFNYKTYGVKKC